MMGKAKCSCRHLGNCPFQPDWSRMTDLEGRPLYRALTPDEARNARIMAAGQMLHQPPVGGFVGTDGQGNAALLAMPVDVERVLAYAEQRTGTTCRADKFWWRIRHPAPPLVDDSAPSR